MKFSVKVKSPAAITIEELVKDNWQLGKKTIHSLRMQKAFQTQEGIALDWSKPLEVGQLFQITFEDEGSSYFPSPKIPVQPFYEDDHFLIVGKPAGLKTHPNEPTETQTLMNGVFHYLDAKGHSYAEHVHRLDEGTSGLVLIAKHPIAKNLLDRMLEKKQIVRTYEAIVEGAVKNDHGTIKAAIASDRHHPTRRRVSQTGQSAITHYQVVGRNPQMTKVHVLLETGRTHQIRVHMAHLGHPIVGDTLYGAKAIKAEHYALQAFRIQFRHPITGELVNVEIPRS